MSKVVTVAFLWLLAAGSAKSQGQLPDGGFESWVMPPFSSYEEPSSNWWTTLNALTSLTAPTTVEKTTDRHSGSFAAKLTTRQWGTVLLPGLLVSGNFDIQNPNFLVQGQPFTDLPLTFRGWYKYSPVAGDSAGIATLLTKWNTGQQRRDTLAVAATVIFAAQSAWTEFDLPFIYQQTGVTPDTILVAMVSSGDGQNFNGQVGSTLWIDDVSLGYATAAGNPMPPIRPKVQLAGRSLTVELPQGLSADALHLLDIHGRCLAVEQLDGRPLTMDLPFPGGIYFARIFKGGRVLHTQKIALFQP